MKEPAGKAGFGSYLVEGAARTMSGDVSRHWSGGEMAGADGATKALIAIAQ